MIKKILMVFVLIFFVNSEAYALDKKLALEEARIKRVETIIQRVNNIYNFIKLIGFLENFFNLFVFDTRQIYLSS